METFSALLALYAGNAPVTGEFPHKGQWHGALMFYLMCAWINGWVNNGEAGDLRRHCAPYNVTVMRSVYRHMCSTFMMYAHIHNNYAHCSPFSCLVVVYGIRAIMRLAAQCQRINPEMIAWLHEELMILLRQNKSIQKLVGTFHGW